MSDPLETQLDALVCEQWGLLRALSHHADAVKQKVLEQSRETFFAGSVSKKATEEHDAKPFIGPGYWGLDFAAGGVPNASFIKVEIPDDQDRFSAKVRVGLTWKGAKREIKSGLPKEITARFGATLDLSSESSTVASALLCEPPTAIVSRVVEEFERLVDLAVAAKKVIESRAGTRNRPTASGI